MQEAAWWILAACFAGAGCADSGQTGSPADTDKNPGGKVPVYETPVGSDSTEDGSSTGNDLGSNCSPQNIPSELYVPGDSAQAVGGHLVVFAVPFGPPRVSPWALDIEYRGLLIYDISSPTEPRLVGELPLEGRPRQLQVDEGAITVVLSSKMLIDETRVPDETIPTGVTRMLRIDWSDPTAPNVVAETTVAGDFWRFAPTSDGVVLMTSQIEPTASETRCTSSDGTDNGGGLTLNDTAGTEQCGAESASVAGYSLNGTQFKLDHSVQVEGGALQAFMGDGFYAAVAESRSSSPVLHVVQIGSDGTLTQLGPIEAKGSVTAVALQGSILLAATTADDGSAALQVVDVETADKPELLGTTALPTPAHRFTFLPDGSTVLASGNTIDARHGASLVDLEDPTQPSATALGGVVEGGLLGERVVGLAPNDSGKLSITLWDVSSPQAPSRLAQKETSWAYLNSDAVIPSWKLDADLGCLAYPTYSYADDGSGIQLGVACIEGETISVLGLVDTEGESSVHPVVADSAIYGVTDRALYGMSVGASTSELDVGEPIEIYSATARRVLQERTAGSYRAELVWENNELAVELIPRDGSGETFRTELEHFSEGLAVVGDRVVALGLRRSSDCDLVSDYPDIAAEAMCPTPNKSGITVINVADGPRVEATFPIDNSMDVPDLPADASSSSDWYGYARLSDGRLFMPVARYIRCASQAACDELGLQAHEGFMSPGSGTCGANEGCSSESQEPIVTYSGVERQLWGYVLDLNDPNGPRLLPGKCLAEDSLDPDADRWTLSAEGPLDLGRQVLLAGDTVGFVSEQWLYDEKGAIREDDSGRSLSRYWLRRVKVDAENNIEWFDRVNTPGPAIALTSAGESAFSVAPDADDGSGTGRMALYRLSLENGGATIEETLSLGAGYRDTLTVGKRAYFLFGPEDRCEANPSTEFVSVALNADPLKKTVAFDLPFDNWRFAIWDDWWEPGTVMLRGGPQSYQARLEVDVSGSEPEVVRYKTSSD